MSTLNYYFIIYAIPISNIVYWFIIPYRTGSPLANITIFKRANACLLMQEFCVIYANALFFNFYDNPFHVGTENPLFHVGHSGQHGIEADMRCNMCMHVRTCTYVRMYVCILEIW